VGEEAAYFPPKLCRYTIHRPELTLLSMSVEKSELNDRLAAILLIIALD
jgi:hypothetical protein